MWQKKSLSQVFLKVSWPAERMVSILRQWGAKHVLEIGPGSGVLTRELLKAGFYLTAVEKDTRFADELKTFKATLDQETSGRFLVENADILQFSLETWLNSLIPDTSTTAIVGNIPYQISSPILSWALAKINALRGVILMVQEEFGERLLAHPGTKTYGRLSLFAQLRSNINLEGLVNRTSFQPVPNVDSAIVSLTPRQDKFEAKFLSDTEKISQIIFSQRRKMLRNSLKPLISDLSGDLCPIKLDRRPETLSIDEFVNLVNWIKKR